jgi:hypothetical protein
MATQTAADYSTTAVANGLYYPLSSNPSGYLTSASLSGYATESFVTSQGYITSAALSPYLTSATAASTYQTISGMSSYLTTSAAASTYLTQSNAATTYYPLSSNPAGYLTSAPVTSVAGKTGAVSLVVADVSGAAPTASPALTGTPTAPTATAGTNTTQISTTEFVQTARDCKAWVNFNGQGTVAIRASYNVTSITDNGTGDYTVNFTTAMVDNAYSQVICASPNYNVTWAAGIGLNHRNSTLESPPTTTQARFQTPGINSSIYDAKYICASFFR